MKAIIKDKYGQYLSIIFAIKQDGFKSECVAFNRDFSQVQKIKMWGTKSKIKRNVYIVEWDKFESKKGDFEGFDFVLNDESLMQALNVNGYVKVDKYSKFTDFIKEEILPEWIELKDENGIQGLMEAAFNFHDSYMGKDCIKTEDDKLQIKFDTTWDCDITIRFIDVKSCLNIDKVLIIDKVNIEIKDKKVFFKIIDFVSKDSYKEEIADPFIECEKIMWKINVK